jgi:Pvc16 N-terminal domain
MIGNAMILLREELSAYMIAQGDPANVIIENIGLFETDSGDNLEESIVITVVNIEEESTLKNGRSFSKWPDGMARYENRPVFLNLYVLFTANFSGGVPPNNGYVQALKRLSLVIEFFQGKTVFTPATSTVVPLPPELSDLSNPDVSSLKVSMELYTLTFEQINHLWGSLGGRQMPSAMYKARLVCITERSIRREVPLIEEIETTLTKTPDNC